MISVKALEGTLATETLWVVPSTVVGKLIDAHEKAGRSVRTRAKHRLACGHQRSHDLALKAEACAELVANLAGQGAKDARARRAHE